MPTDPQPTANEFTWLPLAKVLAWLNVDDVESNAEKIATIEDVRLGACEWIEDQRPDLRATVDDVQVFQAKYRTKVAARLAIARLLPNVAGFQELGAGAFLDDDPNIRLMLGRRRPVLG